MWIKFHGQKVLLYFVGIIIPRTLLNVQNQPLTSFLRNFTKFTGKNLSRNFSRNKVAAIGLQVDKKEPQQRCFLVKFVKFFGKVFL